MSAEDRIRAYYETLRDGDPLAPYFAEDDDLVKVGISERLVGYEAVQEGLRQQTRSTKKWTVESRDFRVVERDEHAWFADAVRMAWADEESGKRYEFDSRWSGTLEHREEWVFVGMHVSAPHDL